MLERYNQVFKEVFDIDSDELNENFTYERLHWDSLVHLNLINSLEETFGIMFETEDILNFGGYLNGIAILEKYGIDFKE